MRNHGYFLCRQCQGTGETAARGMVLTTQERTRRSLDAFDGTASDTTIDDNEGHRSDDEPVGQCIHDAAMLEMLRKLTE